MRVPQDHILASVLHADVSFVQHRFATPLRLSSGTIDGLAEAQARVTVRVDGVEAQGRGSIFLSAMWAWPDPKLSHDAKEKALQQLCRETAANLSQFCGKQPAHPLTLGLALHDAVCHNHTGRVPSILARAMAISPFDAAIHDAVGIAMRRSAFDLYPEHQPIPSADRWLDGKAASTIRHTLRSVPRRALPGWWIVNPTQCLDDVVQEGVHRRGYTQFKLKTLGRDAHEDAARTVEVFRALSEAGVQTPRITVDSNEANPDARSVLDYLHRLRALDRSAFDALCYLEQPTARDIVLHPFDWHKVADLKPVLLDEGLTGMGMLSASEQQGWSGLALKTCKGHSLALLAAAYAHSRGWLISLQDLTNPGLSLVHGALCAAYVPTVNGVELNSPQFAPAANSPHSERFPELFNPKDGVHRLPNTPDIGLGSEWLCLDDHSTQSLNVQDESSGDS